MVSVLLTLNRFHKLFLCFYFFTINEPGQGSKFSKDNGSNECPQNLKLIYGVFPSNTASNFAPKSGSENFARLTGKRQQRGSV